MNRQEIIAQKIAAGLSRQQAEDVVSREEAERIPKLRAALAETKDRMRSLLLRHRDIQDAIEAAAAQIDVAEAALQKALASEGGEITGAEGLLPEQTDGSLPGVGAMLIDANPAGSDAERIPLPSGPGFTIPEEPAETPVEVASSDPFEVFPAGEAPAETPADEAPAETPADEPPAEKPKRGKGK